MGFPHGISGKESAWKCRRLKRLRFDPWVGKIPGKRAWQPTPVFLPGESVKRGAWQVIVHRVAQSWTWLKQLRMHTLSPGQSKWSDIKTCWLRAAKSRFPNKIYKNNREKNIGYIMEKLKKNYSTCNSLLECRKTDKLQRETKSIT